MQHQDQQVSALSVDAATKSFFAATQDGVLLIKTCPDCGKSHWYPRPLCPYCLGDTQWMHASGRGEIYSVSVTRRAGPTNYAIAYVRLSEGVTVLTNIVDCDFDALRIGQRVRVVFKPAENGTMLPFFTPD